MAITQTNHNREWRNGVLIADQTVVVDVTAEVVTLDLHAKARAALTANATYLAIASPTAAQNTAQAKALTRQVNGIIRLLIAALSEQTDLLVESTDV